MRRLRVTPAWREALLATGLTAVVGLELASSNAGLSPARVVVAPLITVPLALRLRFPLPVLSLVIGGLVAESALGGRAVSGPTVPAVAVLLALYGVGSRTSGWRLALGGAIAFVGAFAASRLEHAALPDSLALSMLLSVSGLLVGAALGTLRYESDLFDERASRLERERDERERAAVADERRRIARELHDVIGHSISVMGVQAGAVRSVLHEDQRRERETLFAVEQAGREAVGEMRRLLGLLRTDSDNGDGPTPTLRRIEQLVSDTRDAGLAVDVSVRGDLAKLPPGVDLAGYRIVQEALTNVLKHAPGARVDVTLTRSDRALEIDVIDDGGSAPHAKAGHAGHGLLGMRERTSLYGGELKAEPRAVGGFAVHARIPLEAS